MYCYFIFTDQRFSSRWFVSGNLLDTRSEVVFIFFNLKHNCPQWFIYVSLPNYITIGFFCLFEKKTLLIMNDSLSRNDWVALIFCKDGKAGVWVFFSESCFLYTLDNFSVKSITSVNFLLIVLKLFSNFSLTLCFEILFSFVNALWFFWSAAKVPKIFRSCSVTLDWTLIYWVFKRI